MARDPPPSVMEMLATVDIDATVAWVSREDVWSTTIPLDSTFGGIGTGLLYLTSLLNRLDLRKKDRASFEAILEHAHHNQIQYLVWMSYSGALKAPITKKQSVDASVWLRELYYLKDKSSISLPHPFLPHSTVSKLKKGRTMNGKSKPTLVSIQDDQMLYKRDSQGVLIDAYGMAVNRLVTELLADQHLDLAAVCPHYGVLPLNFYDGLIEYLPNTELSSPELMQDHIDGSSTTKASFLGLVVCGQLLSLSDRTLSNVLFNRDTSMFINIDYGYSLQRSSWFKTGLPNALISGVPFVEFEVVYSQSLHDNVAALYKNRVRILTSMQSLSNVFKEEDRENAVEGVVMLLCYDGTDLYPQDTCFHFFWNRIQHQYRRGPYMYENGFIDALLLPHSARTLYSRKRTAFHEEIQDRFQQIPLIPDMMLYATLVAFDSRFLKTLQDYDLEEGKMYFLTRIAPMYSIDAKCYGKKDLFDHLIDEWENQPIGTNICDSLDVYRSFIFPFGPDHRALPVVYTKTLQCLVESEDTIMIRLPRSDDTLARLIRFSGYSGDAVIPILAYVVRHTLWFPWEHASFSFPDVLPLSSGYMLRHVHPEEREVTLQVLQSMTEEDRITQFATYLLLVYVFRFRGLQMDRMRLLQGQLVFQGVSFDLMSSSHVPPCELPGFIQEYYAATDDSIDALFDSEELKNKFERLFESRFEFINAVRIVLESDQKRHKIAMPQARIDTRHIQKHLDELFYINSPVLKQRLFPTASYTAFRASCRPSEKQ